MKLTKQDKLVYGGLSICLLVIVGILIFNSISTNQEIDFQEGEKILEQKSSIKLKDEIIKRESLTLPNEDILISFRIDDITFETKQKQILLNALELARKYNITFDLAVIAKTFDEKADPEVFKIYEDNQDVFEIVAHGWNHRDYQNESCSSKSCFIDPDCGEFECAPYEQQERHIKQMKEVFEKHNLYWATKIFLLPWNSGDEITLKLTQKYEYVLMTQLHTPNNKVYDSYNGLIVSRSYVTIPMNEQLTEEKMGLAINRTINLIDNNEKRIQIVMHPINFGEIENSDKILRRFSELQQDNPRIKFGFIWEGL